MEINIKILFALLITLFTVATSPSSFASCAWPAPCVINRTAHCIDQTLYDGFYVGIGGGYDTYQIRETSGIAVTANPKIDTSGFAERLFGGYGQYYCDFYYAGEISVTGSGASSHLRSTAAGVSHSVDANMRVSYAGSLLGGIKVTDKTLLYIRIAAVRSLLNTDETITSAGLSMSSVMNNWIDGLRYGIGIETGLFNDMSMRVEYTRTNYGTEGSDFDTRFNPNQGEFMIDFIYHFVC